MEYIIITGASKGLGKALSLNLAKNNNKIYMISRNLEELKKNSLIISNNRGKAEAIGFDLNKNIKEISYLMEDIINTIDLENCDSIVLINNAGVINPIDFIGNLSIDDILTSLNTNCLASIIIINEFINKIKNIKCSKKIINISSGVIFNPLNGWGLYSASKSAVNTFLQTLNKEQGNNIKIVSIDPGVMDTQIQDYIRSIDISEFKYINNFIKYYNEGVLKSPDFVAKKIREIYIEDWMASKLFEKIKDYE